MNGVNSYELARGVNLRVFKTDKFKTNLISLYIHLPLERETVTKAALLPRVLKRGTEKYPSLTELSKRSEELYGARLGASVVKKGDTELLRFSVQFVSDDFINGNITSEVVDILKQFVLHPKTENGGFVKLFVEQEKENAKSFILGLINDKKEYAQVKCNEIMFEGDPYGIFEYGYVEDLESIDEKNLYEFYLELIKKSAIDIFVSGSFDEQAMLKTIKEAFDGGLNDREVSLGKTKIAAIEKNIKIKEVTEPMQVTQSKLCMGFNCGVEPNSEEYYGLMLFTCIYGGSPFSKLFNNVREKLSLAYYVFSATDRQKSCMKVSAGIEADKFGAAYNEIKAQLEKMKSGDFTDDEMASAKKYLATGMNSIKDSLAATENFYISQIVLGAAETVDEALEKINAVTREMVVDVANRIQEDTIYFLKGAGGNEV